MFYILIALVLWNESKAVSKELMKHKLSAGNNERHWCHGGKLPPVVYATDRSKAVVPVLFLILCSFVVYTTGRLMF